MFERFLGKLGAAVLACLLGMLSGVALADFPPTSSFPNTGNFQARFVQDRNDVAIMELVGSYDRSLTDGGVNIEPRTVVAREFLRTHRDRYDFVVVFTNFEFDTGEATAFHIGVQNRVKGIGFEQFDNSAHFGSKGKLQGYIDMAALSRYVTNPFDARFDWALQVFAHEFQHQWGAKARFRGADGKPSSALIGRDGAHWNFLLDSGASVMYGNQWRDNGDGSFTSVAGRQFFSPLDLYLMGMYDKAEVPPFFLIENPEIDPTRLPLNDVTITGTKRVVTIDDIVAVEGEREPAAAASQKEFNLGFVLLARPGSAPTDAEMAAVGAIRRAIATRLAVLTGGRAMAHSYLEPQPGEGADPGENPGGPIREGGADTALGMTWLRGQQATEGYWKDNHFTTLRDTSVVFDALDQLDGTSFTGRARAMDWLRSQLPGNTDYLARQVRVLTDAGARPADAAARLLALQNADGGWGVAPRYESNPLDTALALLALQAYEGTLAKGKLDAATAFLAARQNADGGWGNLAGGASRTAVSSTVLQALKGRATAPALVEGAIAFLAGRQNPDGGFGDSQSTVHDTANAMSALLSHNALGRIRADQGSAYVASSQRVDGSWDGSAYASALALRLLKSAGLFNWTASELKALPGTPVDGQRTVLSFRVANSGSAPAPAGFARVYDGDPGNSGRQIGVDLAIPPLAAGASMVLQLPWDTLDQAGAHAIVAVVDPDNAVTEASKADNRAQVNVTVGEAPLPVELAVNLGEVVATPSRPNRLPATIAISARIGNIGRTDAGNVRVVLREGADGAILDEKIVNLLGRSQQVVNFAATLRRPGTASYTLVIDPDGAVQEADKTNNSAQVTVDTAPSLDLEVRDADTGIERTPVYVGSDALFRTRIRNAGTQDTPPFRVRYWLNDGQQDIELPGRTLQLEAGADASQEIVWRADRVGEFTFRVALDPDNLLDEIDETNNASQLRFAAREGSGINLATNARDFTVEPGQVLEGRPVTIGQTVRNTGTVTATGIEVGFYDGDPSGARLIGPLQTIASLAPGESATVSTVWERYPDGGDHLVFFVADPGAKVADLDREDNSAFTVISADSLPDLALSAGDLQVLPEMPTPGDPLAITVTVSNLGKQAAQGVVVRAYDGDPAQGGRLIGADHVIATMAGLSSQVVRFDYPASGASGARMVVIVVDPDNKVEEKNKDNNRAQRELLAQDGKLFVTNRYFSPNGDGIKDDTTLGFRLDAATDVTLDVVARSKKVLRSIGGEHLKNVSTGSVTWDGLNTVGSIVPDGDYTLRLLGRGGAVLGELKVTLDTNRSSVLKAADTPYGQFTNLTCNISRDHGIPLVSTDEDRVFVEAGEDWWVRDAPFGLFSMLPDATELKALGDFNGADLAHDGRTVVYFDRAASDRVLWAMDADGGNRRPLGKLSDYKNYFLNHDGSEVVVVSSTRVYTMSTTGGAGRVLMETGQAGGAAEFETLSMAPDRRMALVEFRDVNWNTGYRMLDLVSGRIFDVPEPLRTEMAQGDGWYGTDIVWSPNSKLVVFSGYDRTTELGSDSHRFWVFDTRFNLVRSMRFEPPAGVSFRTVGRSLPSWNSDATEFGYELRYCQSDYDQGCYDAGAPVRLAAGSTPGVADSVLMVADVTSGKIDMIEASRVGSRVGLLQYHWVPHDRVVLRTLDRSSCSSLPSDHVSCADAIDLDDGNKVTPVFGNWRNVPGQNQTASLNVDQFLPGSGKLLLGSDRQSNDPASSCFKNGDNDHYIFNSLLNLTADLRVLRTASGGALQLRGTAADANFSRYTIEYASMDAPNVWKATMPASTTPIADGVFASWVPPAYGKYLVRLTVEDLAGNRRQQVRQITWNDTPPINDVMKDSDFVSPNGDGVKDRLGLRYRVAAPVHLVFEVFDAQQTLVRTIARDHYSIGQEEAFQWDGRDDRGRQVRDGEYRIKVLDFEFFVTVDTAPPQASVTLGQAYAFREDSFGTRWTRFAPRLSWATNELQLAGALLERGVGAEPAQWDVHLQSPEMEPSGFRVLAPEQYVGQRYRARFEDRAGNTGSASSELATQQVFLTAYADQAGNSAEGGGAWSMPRGVLHVEAPSVVNDFDVLDVQPGAQALRLHVAESLQAPVARVVIQYQALQDSDTGLPVARIAARAWQEVPVNEFLVQEGDDFRVLGERPLDHGFVMAWNMDNVELDTRYLVRIKVVDETGATFFSVVPHVLQIARPVDRVSIAEEIVATNTGMRVVGYLEGTQDADRVELILRSSADPRFATPRVVHTVVNVGVGSYFDHLLGAEKMRELDLRLCEEYDATLRAYLADGNVIDSGSKRINGCLHTIWTVAPDTPKSCDTAPAHLLRVSLKPVAGDGRKITQLLFGQIGAGGKEDILNNWNNPAVGREVKFDIDASSLPFGTKHYFARVVNEDGKVGTDQILIPVAHAPAELRVTYPAAGQQLCAVPIPNSKEVGFSIEAAMSSDSNLLYAVESSSGDQDKWRPVTLLDQPKHADAIKPIQWSNDPELNTSGAPARNGRLGMVAFNGKVDGEVGVRLRAMNGAGHHVCSAPVRFNIDAGVTVSSTTADRHLFSPKATEGTRQVIFEVEAGETVLATLNLHLRTGGTDREPKYENKPIRSIADNRQLSPGVHQFAWDGSDNSGALAADGQYVLVARYTDSCGNIATHLPLVSLDATAPAIELLAPAPDGKVGLQASVLGRVTDRHFASYEVAYALASGSEDWAVLANRESATAGDSPEELAAWNTLGLKGKAVLRVRALDVAGNLSERLVPVQIVDSGHVVTYVEGVPALFSPNGDGRRESTAIRFNLMADARVRIEIRKDASDGQVARTLIDGQHFPAGAQVVAWDGKGTGGMALEDGAYAAVVIASTTGDMATGQEAYGLLIIDGTPPAIRIDYPVNDFVMANGAAKISVNDPLATSYKVYLSRGIDMASWQLLAEGKAPAEALEVLDLATLAEGAYAIKVVASDEAENVSELVKRFDIDQTPPKVALTAPLSGSFLSARGGPVGVAGSVEERHLQEYSLRLGNGSPGADWVTLLNGAELSVPLAHPWDISKVADGPYTLMLVARDRAGQEANARVAVTIDNTAPRAAITTPANDSYVRGPGAIGGTAHDANLDSAIIEIAPGRRASANRWSQLATIAASVESGLLHDWQAMPVDGQYTLRLTVTDKTGAVSEAFSEVTVDTTAPAAPLSLAAKLENRNDAHLSWSASPESDLAGYALYRNGKRTNDALLTATSYVDTGLANDNYVYEVKALDKAGWESPLSNPARVAVNMSGPSARIVTPTRGALVGAVYDIRGTANAPADFKEYRLYVGAGEAPGAWRLLRRSPAPVVMNVLASWDTLGIAENSAYALKLEAEDIYGSVASDIVTVAVDNTPPPAPLQLVAEANGADVTLRWQGSAATDLAGYIVLRDERIANAPGPVIGSWKPYLVTATNHVDLQVADGRHRYTVVAMDRAENLSNPSNVAEVTIDMRAPHAVLVQPLANAHIGRSAQLLATTPDTDVASVRFQYQRDGEAAWTDAGGPATTLPYAATLDGAAFIEGDYLLRAVATDVGGRADPAPAVLRVTFSETPDVISDLKATVDGGDVTLTWSSNAAGLTGYVLERDNPAGGTDRIEVPASARVTWVDRNLEDFTWRYRVSAVGASGKPNMASDDIAALVFTPAFEVPFTPTAQAAFRLTGRAPLAGAMTLAGVADVVLADQHFDTDAEGGFGQAAIALPMGDSQYELRHRDAAGNVSKPARFEMRRGTPPPMPTGLAIGDVDGRRSITWDASQESGFDGYRVVRNGAPMTEAVWVARAEASSSAADTYPGAATDGYFDSWWSPDWQAAGSARHLTLWFSGPAPVSEVYVDWMADGIARDYDLQIPAGAGNWVTLASVRGNTETARIHAVPQVATTQLRIVLRTPQEVAGATVPTARLAEITPFGPRRQWENMVDLEYEPDVKRIAVSAINVLGMESAAATIETGVDNRPDLTVDAGSILADRSDLRAGDALRLQAVVRNIGAGEAGETKAVMTVTDSAGRSVVIGSADLWDLAAGGEATMEVPWIFDAAGQYTVSVTADPDALLEETDRTNNSAAATLAVLPPETSRTIALKVSARPDGRALQLAWTAPAGVDVSWFRIRWAPAAEGPYQELNAIDELAFLDDTVEAGVRRFYIVSAMDENDRMLATSPPVDGLPRDTEAPSAPVLLTPTWSGKPVAVDTATVDIGGRAEAGARVELLRAGAVLDTATATINALRRQFGSVGSDGDALFDVSVDERMLASAARAAIVELDTGESQDLPELASSRSLRWSHTGALLAVTAYDREGWSDRVRLYDRAARAFVQTIPLNEVRGVVAWSHDDARIAVAGRSDMGEQGLWLVDRSSGEQRLLVAGYPDEFDVAPAFTPDGIHLAFVQDGLVKVVATVDGAVVFAETRGSTAPSWSYDGRYLIYQFRDEFEERVARFTLADGEVRTLTPEHQDARQPLWAGPTGEFITDDQDGAWLRGADGARIAQLVADNYAGGLTGATGALWHASNGNLERVMAPGSFTFAKVRLNAGANTFTAIAADTAGNRSPASEPIEITLQQGKQPDLAASGLVVLPSAPLLGEASRISATLRNAGGTAATDFSVDLALRGPDGVARSLHSSTIERLEAGASRTVTVDWTPAVAGEYSLVLTLDAGDTVRESNESNNQASRTLLVATEALPTVGVTLDASLYGANAAVAGKVTLSNSGPEVKGTLSLRIEDLAGYAVAELSTSGVTLPYGRALEVPASWNTGAVLAGDYRLVAQLRDARGVLLASGHANFAIGAQRDVDAALTVEFAEYPQHAAAAIRAVVSLADGNAALSDARALVEVIDPAGAVVFTSEQDLGRLAPGASVNRDSVWNVGAAAPGNYRVMLAVRSGDTLLASAQAAVAVREGSAGGGAGLQGALRLSSPTVAIGDRLEAAYTLRNDGPALANVPLTVTVVDPQRGLTLDEVLIRVDLAHGVNHVGLAEFKVSAWPLTTLQVVLAAELDGKPNVLQRSTLRALDRTPPLAAFVRPPAYAGAATPILLMASDSQSLVSRVEYTLGASTWTAFALENRAENLYRMGLAGIPDGPLRIQARAVDAADNVSEIVELTLTVDNTAPLIAVAGVADGVRYDAPVTPVVTVSDANLASGTVTLDGAPYLAGTPVAAVGEHVLLVEALDLAGNRSTRSIGFSVGSLAPPTVTLLAPAPGALLRTPFEVSLGASAHGAALAAVEYRIDDGAWQAAVADAGAERWNGAVAQLADGVHRLAARASDADGRTTVLAPVEVTVDNSAPVITIGGVADGASYSAAVTPVVTVSDAHPGAVTILLDGVAFVPGRPVSAFGSHLLSVSALDQLGNKSEATVRFTLQAALSGNLRAEPKEVEAGATVALTRTVVNGGAALDGVLVQLTIQTPEGVQVFAHDETVALAAGGSWSGALGWQAVGVPGTRYRARLTAVHAGKPVLLGEEALLVIEGAPKLDVSIGAALGQRILVLSQCQRAETARLGSCGKSPLQFDDPGTLARCDTARAQAVTRYLDQIGVRHKVVTTEAQFAQELRSGGYSGYWVSGGGTKLRQPLPTQLGAGLQLGEALVADGMHALRDNDRALQELLSVYDSGERDDSAATGGLVPGLGFGLGSWLREFLGAYQNGSRPGERSGTLRMLGELYPVDDFDIWGERLQLDGFDGARVEGVIRPRGLAGEHDGHNHGPLPGHHHRDGHGLRHGFHHHGGHQHHGCEPERSTRPGVVSGSFGAGHTLYFGFDWVASFKAGAANPRWLDVGRTSFEWLRPNQPDAGAALVAGEVVTRSIAVQNGAKAQAVRIQVQLPCGARLLEAGPQAQAADKGGVTTVTWQLQLAADASRTLSLQLKLPLAAGMHELRYTATAVAAKAGAKAGAKADAKAEEVLDQGVDTLQVNGVAEWAAQVREPLERLDLVGGTANARDDVLAWIAKAQRSSAAGQEQRALRELVMAQTRIERLGEALPLDAQLALARMIRAVERRQ